MGQDLVSVVVPTGLIDPAGKNNSGYPVTTEWLVPAG